MASRTASSLLPRAIRQLRPQAFPRARPLAATTSPSPRHFHPILSRAQHTIPRPTRPQPTKDSLSSAQPAENPASEGARPDPKVAYYQLSFTCVPCGHRSHHNVSKQGYHTGSTLITCPSCRNRHIISDHLGIFGEEKISIEDILKEKGQLVKRGTLGEDGDVEFWPDDQATTPPEGGSEK